MKPKDILVEGKILRYYENLRGKKQHVFVFLHGWMQDAASFQKILELLSEHEIPWISFDLPGFGGSQLKHLDMKIEDYAKIIEQACLKLELNQVLLVGHSFGGRISIYLAGTQSPIVSKIVLVSSAGIAHSQNFFRKNIIKVGKIIFSLPLFSQYYSLIQRKFSSRDANSAGKMKTIFRNTITRDLQEEMKQIHIPTLILWGENDTETPLSEGKIMHQHIQHSHMKIFPGDHFFFQKESEKVAHLLAHFR